MAIKKAKKTAAATAEKKTVKRKTTAAKTTKKSVSVKKDSSVKQQVLSKKQEEFVNNSNSYVLVDYPVENETVNGSNEYVLRIGASFDGYVEISFNDGEWQPCRFASGYWWYDWNFFKPGDIKIVARLVGNDGKILKISDIRKCKVS